MASRHPPSLSVMRPLGDFGSVVEQPIVPIPVAEATPKTPRWGHRSKFKIASSAAEQGELTTGPPLCRREKKAAAPKPPASAGAAAAASFWKQQQPAKQLSSGMNTGLQQHHIGQASAAFEPTTLGPIT